MTLTFLFAQVCFGFVKSRYWLTFKCRCVHSVCLITNLGKANIHLTQVTTWVQFYSYVGQVRDLSLK